MRRPVEQPCRRRRAVFDAVPRPQRFPADRAVVDSALWIIGKNGSAAQGPEGADRLAQGQSGQGDGRHHRRRRRHRTCAWSISRTTPAPNSSWCLIAARRRSCRTCGRPDRPVVSRGRADAAAISRAARSRPTRCMQNKRWFAAPDVPTIDEAGAPGLHFPFWHGMWAPKGTPKDVGRQAQRRGGRGLADPRCRSARGTRHEASAARAADAGGAARLPQGRDRQMVADDQGAAGIKRASDAGLEQSSWPPHGQRAAPRRRQWLLGISNRNASRRYGYRTVIRYATRT